MTTQGMEAPATTSTGVKARYSGAERPANLNPHVARWIDECAGMCQPDRIQWCSGSIEERRALFDEGVEQGIFIRLNQEKLPGCYLHRSNPNDVARSEQCTFIC